MTATAAMQAQPRLSVDVLLESEAWAAVADAADTIRRAIAEAAAAQGRGGNVAVALIDDAAIRTMNATWRGLDKATNVLSFPTARPVPAGQDIHLGDIAIAYETTAREAEAENKPLLHHLAHLAIHGYLHLIGFDHETDREAEQMEGLETRILSRLGIADPHAQRDSGPT